MSDTVPLEKPPIADTLLNKLDQIAQLNVLPADTQPRIYAEQIRERLDPRYVGGGMDRERVAANAAPLLGSLFKQEADRWRNERLASLAESIGKLAV